MIGLEVVEVEEDHGELEMLAPGPCQSMAHALVEERAVGELGHRIMKCLMLELRLECLAFTDIPTVEDDPAHRFVLDEVGVQDLELASAPVAMAQRAFDHLGVAADVTWPIREQVKQPAVLTGQQQPVEPGPDDLLGRIAEGLLDRWALVDHCGVRVENCDQVMGVLDEGAEARFARPAMELFRQGIALQCERHLRGQSEQPALGRARCSALAGGEQQPPLPPITAQWKLDDEHVRSVGRQSEIG